MHFHLNTKLEVRNPKNNTWCFFIKVSNFHLHTAKWLSDISIHTLEELRLDWNAK